MKIEFKRGLGYLDQLTQLTTVTCDSDLICKDTTRELVRCGYAYKLNGLNVISENGIIVLNNLGVFKN